MADTSLHRDQPDAPIADDVFEVQDDGTVLIRDNERPESDRLRLEKAVTQCPAAALRLVD